MWVRVKDMHQADQTWVNLDQVTFIEFHHRQGHECVLLHLSDAINRSIDAPEAIKAVKQYLEDKSLISWDTVALNGDS